ncbi:MAG: aminoacetone oxidase family FAD-binding enzyme [Oscillospiraceae bacterium]|nr:aminoacetone oxidase family FAD-binding enzyme [Oscillospiraceae bacterium]
MEASCCAAARAQKTAAGYAVLDEDGNGFEAGLLLLAAGGCAAPALGTDGSGFALARGLGHKTEEPWPALVPFVSSSPLCKGLKGLRAEGKLTLCRNGRVLAEEMGEVQFTEYGLSGIPAFQLSLAYGAARCRGQESAELRVDFFPEKSRESLVRLLEARLERAKTAEDLLMGTLHWKLTQAVLKTAGVKGQSPARPEQLALIADVMKAMAFPVSGTLGWEQAQAAGGGVSLEEVDAHTLASRLCPGLYLAGEVLDAVGLCGGYNLHWAFGTGILAGEGMAAALLGPAAPAQKAAPAKERKPRREKPKAPAKGKPAKKRK